MQRTTRNLPARLHRGRVLSAAVLTASALLLATAPQAVAQDGVWAHYDVTEPKVITLEFDTDLLAFDLCWSDHTDMVKEQIVNGAIAQMNDPTRLHVIRMPGLPPFYRRTSNASVWHDLNGGVITSSDVLPNRASYHIDVEQALIEIAGRIRAERPGAKLAFEGFELQPLPGRPPAYEELGALQDFYITDRTIFLNHVGHILHHALNSTFYRARVDFAEAQDNWLVFPNQTGAFSLASLDNPAWPPEEIEPEIMALWGGDGDEGGGDGGGSGGGGGGDHGELPALLPGSGWSGPTEQPAPIGSPSADGYDATSIARWDVVPQQVIDGPFPIGVVAFHMNEIDRVEFSADNGPWVSVDEMVYNPRTEVWEYTVLFDPEAFVDGEVEVRAIAYPEVGTPRVLEPLTLYANAGGTIPSPEIFVSMTGSDESGDGTRENPYKTIWRGIKSVGSDLHNVSIMLEPGVYAYSGSSYPQPFARTGWTTIRPAPGVTRNDVVLVRGDEGRIRIDRIRLQNVTVDQTDGWGIAGYTSSGWELWLDGVQTTGPGRLAGVPVQPHFGALYLTESSFTGYANGPSSTRLFRNVVISDIGSDAFQNARVVINSVVNGVDPSGTDFHPDIWQLYGPSGDFENRILYNVRTADANSQGIFFSGTQSVSDIAIVNFSMDRTGSNAHHSQIISDAIDHLVVKHVSMPNQAWVWRSDDIRNVRVTGSLWQCVKRESFQGNDPIVEDSWYSDNHFIDGSGWGTLVLGTGASVGDPMVVEENPGEFRPMSSSPLRSRLSRTVPVDLTGHARETNTSIGAFQ